jgi:hypothetical protein
MPASALYHGETLETRVRRLIEPRRTAAPARLPRRLTHAIGAVAVTWVLTSLESVHGFVEVLIHRLP